MRQHRGLGAQRFGACETAGRCVFRARIEWRDPGGIPTQDIAKVRTGILLRGCGTRIVRAGWKDLGPALLASTDGIAQPDAMHLFPGRAARAVAATLALALASCARLGDGVRGSGTIEMDEVDVASLIGGRVSRLFVDEGEAVQAGDTLAMLDRGEVVADLEAQVALADGSLAQLRDLREGPRAAEIEAAQSALEAAKAQAKLAAAEAQRVESLFKSNVASQADVDRAEAARDAAAASRDESARRLALLEAGTRREQVTAAEKATEAARAQLAAARSRARELVLVAPITGVVLLKNLLPGEIAQPGVPVVTLGNPDSLWLRAYIAVPRLGEVKLGAPAEVTTPGAPGKRFPGRVVEIASRAEFTPRAALTEEERANLVFGVKIALAPSNGTLKAGLPAEARILSP
jgi:HlyD family secretion protein